MRKHSKRRRRRMRQHGMGGGFRVVHRMPKVARRLPHAPVLTPEMEFRLRCIEHAQRTSVADAARVFRRNRSTIYRWLTAYDATDLRSLRQCFPRYGKAKLVHLLRANDIVLSASTIGRILASLKQRRLLIEPHAVRVRPYATRIPKEKRQPTTPGQLIQLDTMRLRPLPGVERRQFTAIDVVSRCAVLGVRAQATAGTATAFLDELCARIPVPIQAIQVDGGAAWSWRGLRLPVRSGVLPSTCCHPAPQSSMAMSSGSTAPGGESFGSAMPASWTCHRCSRRFAPLTFSTLRNDHTKRSGTRRPSSISIPSVSHMYRTRTSY